MKQNDEYTVKIEKLSNLGTGIAKIDGQVIFVENVCPQDEVKIKIIKANKNYATAIPIEIITPSEHRIEPFCPMQKVCGSCQLQFIDYAYQLELKRQMVEDAIRKIGGLDVQINFPLASPDTKEFRQSVRRPIRTADVSATDGDCMNTHSQWYMLPCRLSEICMIRRPRCARERCSASWISRWKV